MGTLMILKSIFSRTFAKIFSDWRILLAVIIFVVAGIVLFRVHKIEKNLEHAKAELAIEKKNNDTLRGNVATLVATNESNGIVIQQVTNDKNAAIQSVTKLSNSIADTNKSVASLKSKIDELKAAPVALTPYLSEAVEGIQKLRDEANPDKKDTK